MGTVKHRRVSAAGAVGLEKDIYRLRETLSPIPARRLRLAHQDPKTILNQACLALKNDRLVILPTDTVYGIAAIPSPAAIAALYRAKGRQQHNPLVLLISQASQAERFAMLSPKARALLETHWPGALTLVLPVRRGTDWGKLTRGGRWIGLRCPAHGFTRQLIKRCGGALATSSANRSGQSAATNLAMLDPKLLSFADYVIDDGPSPRGISSTVAKVSGRQVQVLRQGDITL
jgi:L-threonylcarbamoyladenylate synthase